MDPLLEVSLRWAHVLAGICWIGLLYFFNFVNVPFQGTIDPATKKVVNPQMLSRALWWFRWAAMLTMLIGLYLFIALYMKKPEDGGLMREVGKEGLSQRANSIMIAMTLALVMWFNVWFIIWPNQKKIIAGMLSGNAAPPECAKRALMASRFNCYSSGPMLFLMIAAPHGGGLDLTGHVVAFVVPLLVIHLAIKASGGVGKPV